MANDNITIYNGEGVEETTREMTDAEMADRTSLASELTILRAVRNDLLAQTDFYACLLYTSPSPRDSDSSRMPSSA